MGGDIVNYNYMHDGWQRGYKSDFACAHEYTREIIDDIASNIIAESMRDIDDEIEYDESEDEWDEPLEAYDEETKSTSHMFTL